MFFADAGLTIGILVLIAGIAVPTVVFGIPAPWAGTPWLWRGGDRRYNGDARRRSPRGLTCGLPRADLGPAGRIRWEPARQVPLSR
jgi:hypothetical protein